jgi:hypothetical protein
METPGHSFCDLTKDKCKKVLIQAIANILMKCKDKTYRIVTLNKTRSNDPLETEMAAEAVETEVNHDSGNSSEAAQPEVELMKTSMENLEAIELAHSSKQVDHCEPATVTEEQGSSVDLDYTTSEQFHERLFINNIATIDDVEKFYSENFEVLSEKFGVLLLLYTVLLTKGIENVLNDLGQDTSEPLIHSVHAYGSQALINLMLTGRAVANVLDNEQDVGGLKLKGINQQSDIGFITLMENLQYCTVGSFYKNPKNPVWVMGSDTHLTVLFSNEKRLVSPETPSEIARRVFRKYDTDGSNFIQTGFLQDLLCELDLVSEPEYVEIMKRKLDPESLGIILLNDFMYEFFPEDSRSVPDTFDLLHYNGIPNSNRDNKVRYSRGTAILLESDLKSMCSQSNPMLTCLQTKWPTIEINWEDKTPSLN